MLSCSEYSNIVKEKIKNLDEVKLLAIIQVGDNQDSNAYVKGKIKDCEEVGVLIHHKKLPKEATTEQVLEYINKLKMPIFNCDGIIIQLPLPKHIDLERIIESIPKELDVDGFRKDSNFIPCTPLGVLNYLKYNNIQLQGRNIVVIGRSEIVGKPLFDLLLRENATVTLCHSHTSEKSLKGHIRNADIVISCVGKQNLLNMKTTMRQAWKKPIVIDVGINRDESGKLCGDANYNDIKEYCTYVTPVPKGVELLTRVALLENLYKDELKNAN